MVMMKKALLMVLTMAFVSTSAFALTIKSDATTSIGGATFAPSTNVTIEAAATKIAYTATSCHLSGSKEYATAGGTVGTSVDASKINAQDIPNQGTNTACNPTDPGTAGTLPF